MSEGESKTETIPTENAYGSYAEEMVITVDREAMPAEIEPAVGQQFQLQQPDGQVIPVIVTDVSNATITLDANHPLAGENLTFEIQLVEIA